MEIVKEYIVKKQPVMVAAIVTWLTGVGANFGLHLEPQGVVLVTGAVGFVVSWLARSVVWSQHTLDKDDTA